MIILHVKSTNHSIKTLLHRYLNPYVACYSKHSDHNNLTGEIPGEIFISTEENIKEIPQDLLEYRDIGQTWEVLDLSTFILVTFDFKTSWQYRNGRIVCSIRWISND